MSLNNRNTFADSVFEPLFGICAIVVPSGPALPAGYTSAFFVDDVGQSAAGNITIVEGDTNLSGGVIPQGVGFELYDLSIFARLSTFATAPTDASLLALTTGLRVRLHYADQAFELGPLARFMGPYGSSVGLNNVVQAQRLAYAGPGAEVRNFICEPAQKFKLELKSNRLIDAGVVASTTYVFHAVMNRRAARRGSAAIKQ
jgi:hypothetical protein